MNDRLHAASLSPVGPRLESAYPTLVFGWPPDFLGHEVHVDIACFKCRQDPAQDIAGIDATLGSLAAALTAIMHLLGQLGFSKLFHSIVRGLPLIGKTFS